MKKIKPMDWIGSFAEKTMFWRKKLDEGGKSKRFLYLFSPLFKALN